MTSIISSAHRLTAIFCDFKRRKSVSSRLFAFFTYSYTIIFYSSNFNFRDIEKRDILSYYDKSSRIYKTTEKKYDWELKHELQNQREKNPISLASKTHSINMSFDFFSNDHDFKKYSVNIVSSLTSDSKAKSEPHIVDIHTRCISLDRQFKLTIFRT